MSAEPAKLIWSLSNSGLGTTLIASGNSGAWQSPGAPPWTPNALSAIDMRYVEDIWLTVATTTIGGTGSPSLTLAFNVFDDKGHLFTAYTFTGATQIITGSVVTAQVSLGKHGSAANAYLVFPEWAQISWAITGTLPTFTGTEISVYGR